MSLTHYQQLQQQSQKHPALVGNRLPVVTAATINISTQKLTLTEVSSHIRDFNASAGWVMFRDRLEINNFNPEQEAILEGEWCRDGQSLSVKLFHDDCYILTHLTVIEKSTDLMACTEQNIYIRPELKSQATANACRYRFWWQLAEKGEQKGRWLPLTQQFIGFTQVESIELSGKGGE